MTQAGVSLEKALQMGCAFAGVEKSTAYGSPALKVRGKLMAAVPTHRSAEAGSLMIRLAREDRADLLAESPDLYYVTDHYLNYDAVLVRLDRTRPEILRDLLAMGYNFVTRNRVKG